MSSVYDKRVRVLPSDDEWHATPLGVRLYVAWIDAELGRTQALLALADQQHRDELRRRDRVLLERDSEIARLRHDLARLRETASLTSKTSSKPPSSDPPQAPRRPRSARTARRRGGQPGHPKHTRTLVPVEACASVTDHRPDQCDRCQAVLVGDDPDPLRHQTLELPVVVPIVVEHRLHSLRCACGHTTRAVLPDTANPTGFGPRLEATVATLVGGCRLSHRSIVAMMADLFGVRLGLGTVSTLLRRASTAVAAPVDEARAAVAAHSGARYVDETEWVQRGTDGTNEDGRTAWLWVGATDQIAAYRVTLSRGRTIAREVIGTTGGVVVTDRYAAYSFVAPEHRQLCWAHLKREFVRISERPGASGRVGRALVKVADEVFAAKRSLDEGRMRVETFVDRMGELRQRARETLEVGSGFTVRATERSEQTRTRNTCRELLKVEPAMWTFVRQPGVGLTNNVAERSLRHAVLWRRASFGSQSEAGAEWAARLLTVVMTRRLQGKSAHAYLVEACEAARAGRAAPSLVG